MLEQPILTISILISNNYENVKRCLDSLKPLLKSLPSELILTDTGVEPKLRRLLETYTKHIIDFDWSKDFSAARNAGLEQAKGQWFMYVDDDEWFEDTRAIEDFFLSGKSENYNVAYYTQRNYLHPYDSQKWDDYQNKISGISYVDHYVDRIIRRVPGLHFEHRVHEAYTGIEIGEKKKLNSYVHHYGYAYKNAVEKQKKCMRNKELLELEVKEHPDDMRMRYQLTTACYSLNEWEQALTVAKNGIVIESDSAFWDELHNCIIYCIQREGKWQESIEYANEFLCKKLYPYSYFGMNQYLLKAYWKLEKFENVLQVGKRVLAIYEDYKHYPEKYDRNQILLCEYTQQDQIISLFLMIIEAILVQKDEKAISLLDIAIFKEEIDSLTQEPAYCFGFRKIIESRCVSKKEQEILKKLPFPKEIIKKQIDELNHPEETFNRPKLLMDGEMAESIELEELSFPVEFFQGETRNGFYVEPLMKHAWAAQLNILYQVGQICKANGLPYYVDWGTLLGTVRHKGFIPWDDDIDISMMRNDLFRLAQIIDEQYPSLIFIDCYSSKDHGMQAYRVANTRKLLTDRAELKDSYGFVFPGGIDIFPLDKLPTDYEAREEMKAVHRWVGVADSMQLDLQKKTLLDDDYFIKVRVLETAVGEVEKICHMTFRDKIPSEQELMILMDEVQGLYRNNDFSELTHLFAFCGKGFVSKKENYKDVIMMPFETIMVPVPVGYDRILTGEYGEDYMIPKQIPSFHNYPFYKEYFQTLCKETNAKSLDEFRAKIERQSSEYYKKFLLASPEPILKYERAELESEDNEIEELKRIRAAESEVLEEINRICRKYNLNLYMINENDELDLNQELQLGMFRNQYKKFVKTLPEELDVWFDYHDIYHNSLYSELKTYIITDAYKTKTEDYMERFHGCPHIVGLTIVPIDGVFQEQSKENLREKIFISLMKTAKNVSESGPYSDVELNLVEEWESIVQIKCSNTCNLRQEFVRAADMLAASCDITNTEKVGVFRDPEEGIIQTWKKENFDHCIRVTYGKCSILVPDKSSEM